MTRSGYVKVTATATFGVALAIAVPTSTKLVWNVTSSVPVGLYSIAPSHRLEVTDLVVVDAPEPLATFLSERGYLPKGVPLLIEAMARQLGGEAAWEGANGSRLLVEFPAEA